MFLMEVWLMDVKYTQSGNWKYNTTARADAMILHPLTEPIPMWKWARYSK
jgi:hypothetical protein